MVITNHRGRGYQASFPGADFTDDEREFMVAMDRWKRANRQPFPAWSDVLKVIRSLGYEKVKASADEAEKGHL